MWEMNSVNGILCLEYEDAMVDIDIMKCIMWDSYQGLGVPT